MNILFTSPSYYPHKGGAESCIESLAVRFVQDGHRVTVLTSRIPGSLATEEFRRGVQIKRLGYPCQKPTLAQWPSTVWRSLAVLLSLFRVVKNQRIDVVCLGLVGIESFFVLILRHFIAFRLIVYIHGGEMRSYIRVSPFMRWSLRECLRLCDAAIAVSEKLREETIAFEPLVKNKITVLPCGIDIEEIRMQGTYHHRRPYVLYAGRIPPVKGVEVLIQAIQLVSARIPDLDVLVAGTGPSEGRLRQFAAELGLADRVLFLGAQERSAVFTLLKGREFLVLPCHAEVCPMAILEATAAGSG